MRRLLAFVSCPMFGRLSDVVGRKKCLFVTVLGTASPVMALCVSSNLWVFAAAASFSGTIFRFYFSSVVLIVPIQFEYKLFSEDYGTAVVRILEDPHGRRVSSHGRHGKHTCRVRSVARSGGYVSNILSSETSGRSITCYFISRLEIFRSMICLAVTEGLALQDPLLRSKKITVSGK